MKTRGIPARMKLLERAHRILSASCKRTVRLADKHDLWIDDLFDLAAELRVEVNQLRHDVRWLMKRAGR